MRGAPLFCSCFLSPEATRRFFHGPLFASVAFNVFVFVMTIATLHRKTRDAIVLERGRGTASDGQGAEVIFLGKVLFVARNFRILHPIVKDAEAHSLLHP
jgi:hypothetical protein